MKKTSMLISMVAGAMTASAADVGAGVDFASSYVFRGVTLNDGWVAQPWLESAGIHGFTVGAWGNFDLETGESGSPKSGDFSEVDLYAKYALPIEAVGITLGITEYTYPRGTTEVSDGAGGTTIGPLDADREVNAVLALKDVPLNPTLGAYYGVGGAIDQSWYFELGLSHEEKLTEEITGALKAALGMVEPDAAKSGFNHATLSASLAYQFAKVTVAYVVETDKKVQEIGEDLIVTLGLSGAF